MNFISSSISASLWASRLREDVGAQDGMSAPHEARLNCTGYARTVASYTTFSGEKKHYGRQTVVHIIGTGRSVNH